MLNENLLKLGTSEKVIRTKEPGLLQTHTAHLN